MLGEQRVQHLFFPSTRAECIRILRLRLGFTQGEVAEKLGLSREQVSKMETSFLHVSETLWDFMLDQAYRQLYSDKNVSYEDFKSTVSRLIHNRAKEDRHG
ncbi:helix-turn-helix transcriptional regulator [Paenibacillus sp. GYB003]|uniref:helix-turn-helix transcriptional regulator n=1 Tax=Paenibacillus sp. GYB003 TaxID=2994392 RepID=UPI003FA6E11F